MLILFFRSSFFIDMHFVTYLHHCDDQTTSIGVKDHGRDSNHKIYLATDVYQSQYSHRYRTKFKLNIWIHFRFSLRYLFCVVKCPPAFMTFCHPLHSIRYRSIKSYVQLYIYYDRGWGYICCVRILTFFTGVLYTVVALYFRSTFEKWPSYPAPYLVSELAKQGFFYLGNLDRTQCFCCSGVLRNWAPTDDVPEQHKKHYSNCR